MQLIYHMTFLHRGNGCNFLC